MKLKDNEWYKASEGKMFVLTGKGKRESVNFKDDIVGEPVSRFPYEAIGYEINNGYLVEVDIPGWETGLKGYEVVYYYNGNRLYVGNSQVFPTRKAAEGYKRHYEDYPWFDHEISIEEVEYNGIPLSESVIYNGKEILDIEHYFGLECCEVGDYLTKELIDNFMNMLPPACTRSDCMQIGEPQKHVVDPKDGECKALYATFKKVNENIYEYCGNCFREENVAF